MNQYIKQVIQNATFDTALLAETISYNGVEISAIVENGENELQKSPGGFNRCSNTVVVSGSGYFTVKIEDVPNPKRGDVIVYDSKKYYVAGIELIDSLGGSVTVKVTCDERGYLNR